MKLLNAGALRQALDVASGDSGDPAGPGDDQEAQRSHAAEPGRRRFVCVSDASLLGVGVELEVPDEVVGQDAELLPGTGHGLEIDPVHPDPMVFALEPHVLVGGGERIAGDEAPCQTSGQTPSRLV